MAHRAVVRVVRRIQVTAGICRDGRRKPCDRMWSCFGGVGFIGFGTNLTQQTTGTYALPTGTLVISVVWR